jgi:alkylation response protein AidB-like acyl-CoA dehydrogenase
MIKAFTSKLGREAAAMAREVMGGEGILMNN